MKTKYLTTFLLTFIGVLSFSQSPLYIIDFEGTAPLSTDLPVQAANFNASGNVTFKTIDNTYLSVMQTVNSMVSDGNSGKELFMDFQGHLTFDVRNNPTHGFSFVTQVRRVDHNQWWLGFISITGYDPESGLYLIERMQFKQPVERFSFHGIKIPSTIMLTPSGEGIKRHVVLSFDGTTGLMSLYVDGVFLGLSNENLSLQNFTNIKIYLGVKGRINSATGVFSHFYDGIGNTRDPRLYVDNISYYDRNLSATEVEKLYNETLSVNKPNLQAKLTAYPNPLNNYLNFSNNRVKYVNVYSILGSKILSLKVNENGIDLSNLSDGIYIIKCIDEINHTIGTFKISKN